MVHGYYVEVEPIIMRFLLEKLIHVFYFCGGRGIGKTYGALDMCYRIGSGQLFLDPDFGEKEKFLYLRRTAVEAKSIASPEMSPFKRYGQNENKKITSDFSGTIGVGNFYDETEEDSAIHIGYCAALSTFANLRGVDFSDVSFILYDECIPESKNKRPLKDEGFLLLNMLETINRNRILEGRQEVVLCMLSNPIDLASNLLSQLGFTPILNNMIFKNQQKYTDAERSLHIEKLTDHKVSEDKAQSFLYKFAKDTGFNEASLSGDFVNNDLSVVRKVNLAEYTCEYSLENVFIYKHKSKSDLYYICSKKNTPKVAFKAYEREKFRKAFYWLYKLLVVNRRVFYDNFNTKTVFEEMIKYKPF